MHGIHITKDSHVTATLLVLKAFNFVVIGIAMKKQRIIRVFNQFSLMYALFFEPIGYFPKR